MKKPTRSTLLSIFVSLALLPGCTTTPKEKGPAGTVRGFMEASRKGGGGVEEAILYCTKKAAIGWRGIMEMDPNKVKPTFTSIEYGEEKVAGDNATVSIRVQAAEGGKVEDLIVHLAKEEGKWGVVGIEEETDVTRFDDPELLQMIEYFQRRDKKR